MSTIKCPQCGNPISSDANYCPYCGAEIAKTSASTSTTSLDIKTLRKIYTSISLTFLNQFMLTTTLALLILVVVIIYYLANVFISPIYLIISISIIVIAHLLFSFMNVRKFFRVKKRFRRLISQVKRSDVSSN